MKHAIGALLAALTLALRGPTPVHSQPVCDTVNIAFMKPVSASVFNGSSITPPEHAVDGDSQTAWTPTWSSPNTSITVDLLNDTFVTCMTGHAVGPVRNWQVYGEADDGTNYVLGSALDFSGGRTIPINVTIRWLTLQSGWFTLAGSGFAEIEMFGPIPVPAETSTWGGVKALYE